MTLDPEVFVRAAERMDQDRDRGACPAIFRTAVCDSGPYVVFFEKIFILPKSNKSYFWLYDESLTTEQQKNRRVIALLLAAEIAKDGGA